MLSRRNAFLLSFFVFLVCAAGLPRLSINADTRVFFAKDNENRRALDLFEARYAPGVNLLIVLHAPNGDLFTDDRLRAVEAVTDAAWRLPYSIRVESIANASHIGSDSEGIVIGEAGALDEAGSAANAHARVMTDNLLVSRAIAADGKTTAVNVLVDYPMQSSAATGEILNAAKAMVAELDVGSAGLDVWYGGRVASSFAFSTASKKDLITLIPLTFVLFLALLIVMMRSAQIAGMLFLSGFAAAISTMGLAGWAGLQINAGTAFAPTVIIALGVASFSHLAISYRNFIIDGLAPPVAALQAFMLDRKPIALTLGTTAIGFMTMNAADSPPFRQFGTMVSAGALFCLLFGLVLFPALLSIAKPGAIKRSETLTRIISAASTFAIEHRRALLAIAPLVCLSIGFGLTKIVIDDTFPEYFDERFEFRRHADLIEKHLTGLEVLEFDIGGPGADAIYDPDYIEKLSAFEAWLTAQPKVEHTASILEIYRRLNQHLNDGDPAQYSIPADRAALAQYILLYEMSLPMGQDLTNAITVDKSRSRVTAIMRGASTADVRELKERAEIWLAGDQASPITGAATGLAVMFAYLSSVNVESMIGGTAMALVAISLILIFAFRNLRYGLLSLAPNLLPGAMAIGLWGYTVGEVGVAVSVVGAMTLGIIVDDTIHLIWRYREARMAGDDPQTAARKMFAKVGEPMLISSIVLVSGFLLMSVSGFHITSSTGILVAGTIGFAWALDWFVLAPLLVTLDSVGARRRATATVPDGVSAKPAFTLHVNKTHDGDDAKRAVGE